MFEASSRYKPSSKQTSQNKTETSSNSDILVVVFLFLVSQSICFLVPYPDLGTVGTTTLNSEVSLGFQELSSPLFSYLLAKTKLASLLSKLRCFVYLSISALVLNISHYRMVILLLFLFDFIKILFIQGLQ